MAIHNYLPECACPFVLCIIFTLLALLLFSLYIFHPLFCSFFFVQLILFAYDWCNAHISRLAFKCLPSKIVFARLIHTRHYSCDYGASIQFGSFPICILSFYVFRSFILCSLSISLSLSPSSASSLADHHTCTSFLEKPSSFFNQKKNSNKLSYNSFASGVFWHLNGNKPMSWWIVCDKLFPQFIFCLSIVKERQKCVIRQKPIMIIIKLYLHLSWSSGAVF